MGRPAPERHRLPLQPREPRRPPAGLRGGQQDDHPRAVGPARQRAAPRRNGPAQDPSPSLPSFIHFFVPSRVSLAPPSPLPSSLPLSLSASGNDGTITRIPPHFSVFCPIPTRVPFSLLCQHHVDFEIRNPLPLPPSASPSSHFLAFPVGEAAPFHRAKHVLSVTEKNPCRFVRHGKCRCAFESHRSTKKANESSSRMVFAQQMIGTRITDFICIQGGIEALMNRGFAVPLWHYFPWLLNCALSPPNHQSVCLSPRP